jgi:hypothetical protein
VPTDELIQSVQQFSSKGLERLLRQRQAEDKALRVLLRAAVAREREERRQQRECLAPPTPLSQQRRTGVASA